MNRHGIFRTMALITFFAGFMLAQPASVKMPETAPGKLLGEWLSLCSAPNLESLRPKIGNRLLSSSAFRELT